MTTEPQFKVGDRVFSHYVKGPDNSGWGTVERVGHTDRDRTHGVTGTPMDDTTWYMVVFDDGGRHSLDDAHGNWEMARVVPPHIAERYGYGTDPRN